MKFNIILEFILVQSFWNTNCCSRILVIVSAPIPSHQLFIRPIIHELLNRNHEVVSVTSNPENFYHENFTEIDLHNTSYDILGREKNRFKNLSDPVKILQVVSSVLNEVFEKQLDHVLLGKLNMHKNFDVMIVDACARTLLVLSHVFKIPMILMNSFSAQVSFFEETGAPVHPIINPLPYQKRLYNLTFWEKITSLYVDIAVRHQVKKLEDKVNRNLLKVFGADTPRLTDLRENIALSYLNTHPIWEDNRPLPKSVVNIGGLDHDNAKDLPQNLKSYLDAASNGAIYVSFGTNVASSLLSQEKTKTLANVFNNLPYKVLWKTNENILGNNIKTSNWFPQKELLSHPNLKLFITQAGQHSIDEAINAGVPLISLPMYLDQWYNAEKIAYHKIGVKLDIDKLDEGLLNNTIQNIIEDNSYRNNIIRLRALMRDQPQTPLSRLVWWTEHVLRYRGAKHLRSPAANMSWAEYYAIDVIGLVILMLIIVTGSCCIVVCLLVRWFNNLMRNLKPRRVR